MHQPGAAGRGLLGQYRDGAGIDQAGVVGIALGLVHRGVGTGVDDELRPLGANQSRQAFGVGEIGAPAVTDQQFAQRRQGALQLPADLAVGAEEKDPVHAYCLPTHSR